MSATFAREGEGKLNHRALTKAFGMKRAKSQNNPVAKPAADPLAMLNWKSLALRVGPILLIVWVLAVLAGRWWAFVAAGVVTLLVAVAIGWALRFAKKTQQVSSLVTAAETPEARKEALAKLETEFKKSDTAATFAKAQLLLHEDPRKALAVLEEIKLDKVMAPIADETRAQRAMIHLLLGEADKARHLVDAIELSRHQQAKARAMMTAIISEAWARTGQAKKALDLLGVIDPEDAEYLELKPQLYRARAFAHAAVNDVKGMRKDVHQLGKINPQLLGGFMTKKVHPLLAKEAKQQLERLGAIPRKMVQQRRF